MLCAALLLGLINAPSADPIWSEASVRSLFEAHQARWLNAVSTPSGRFQVELDEQWRPKKKQRATLVSQSRLLYNFAIAYAQTRDPKYLRAVRSGANFLLKNFEDPVHRGFFWAVSDRQPTQTHKSTYGHAFVILGLSHAYRATGEKAYLRGAKRAWVTVKTKLTAAQGGYVQRARRDFKEGSGRSQNPLMHLFEALLALHQASGEAVFLREAERLARFVFQQLYAPSVRAIPETFDDQWRPQRSYIDIGHQFEWAYLLSVAVSQGASSQWLKQGKTLLQTGERIGKDPRGGVFSHADLLGKVIDRDKIWWVQCERLRALVHYAHFRDEPALLDVFHRAWKAFLHGFHGAAGVYEREGTPGDQGSIWKVGYHVTGLYAEALEVFAEKRKRATVRP